MGSYSFYEIAASVLQVTLAALTPPPKRVCVVPGSEIAWDQCDCDGQLVVTYTQLFPSENFPSEQVSEYAGNCGTAYLAGSLVVSVTRCAPSPTDAGGVYVPPTCVALDAAARQQFADATIVWQTVTCHLQALMDEERLDNYFSRDASLLGPQGGCMSVEMRAVVGLLNPAKVS